MIGLGLLFKFNIPTVTKPLTTSTDLHDPLFATADELRARIHALTAAYAGTPHGLLPRWMDATPADLIRSGQFYVCGSVSRSEIRVLARHAQVIGIVDDHLAKEGGRLYGIPVIDTETWITGARANPRAVSCILVPNARATQHFRRQCLQWNLRALSPLQFLQVLRTAGIPTQGEIGRFFWYGYAFFEHTLRNADRLVAAAGLFADAYSQFSFLSILAYRLTLNPYYLDSCAVGNNGGFGYNAYSTNRNFLSFSENEVYADGGAFTGDTVELFLRAVQGRFRRIYTFEPSAANNAAIRARLRRVQDEFLQPLARRVTLVGKGLWNSTTELHFNPDRSVDDAEQGSEVSALSAHIIESGMLEHIYDPASETAVAVKVPVTTLDEATHAEATFVKLEVEGCELQALEGARETIRRNRPQMAISIYHKPEDLLTLTDFVVATGKDYVLGFRQHNPLVPDAMVMYCR